MIQKGRRTSRLAGWPAGRISGVVKDGNHVNAPPVGDIEDEVRKSGYHRSADAPVDDLMRAGEIPDSFELLADRGEELSSESSTL